MMRFFIIVVDAEEGSFAEEMQYGRGLNAHHIASHQIKDFDGRHEILALKLSQ
jgi:hypothetical protein